MGVDPGGAGRLTGAAGHGHQSQSTEVNGSQVEIVMRYPRAGIHAVVTLVAAVAVGAGCDATPERRPEHRPDAAPSTAGASAAPDAAAVPAGTSSRTVRVDGRERTYRLYRPAGVPLTGPVPLVVMLHGALGSGEQAESAYGWNAAADRGGFLVAYPDGLNRAWAVGPECCGAPARDGVDDAGFVIRLAETLTAELPVDPGRVYVTGISNGGMLAYLLACRTDVFAAVAPVAATLLGDCPTPRPVSLIHIHGDADRTVPYAGGPGRPVNAGGGKLPTKVDGPPVPELAARWRAADRCDPPARRTDAPVTTVEARCPDGRGVTLITVAGAGHQWPGAAPRGNGRLLRLDPPSTALDATDTIWRFFQAHPRPN